MLGSALVPAALLLLGGLLLPESPRYLVNKGDTRNAFKVTYADSQGRGSDPGAD